MPFVKGKGGRPKGSKNVPKTIWLLQSMANHGVNLQDLMAKSLIKAAHGDKQALELSHLLAKFLPHIANAPKSSNEAVNIEQLVIARYDKLQGLSASITEPVDTEVIPEALTSEGQDIGPEGIPPSQTDGHL